MTLCQTITPRGIRYYVNGRRISREDYELRKFRRRLDCFLTRINGRIIRHFCCVSGPLP